MKLVSLFKTSALILAICVNAWAGVDVIVVYVKDGQIFDDLDSYNSLKATVANLNAGSHVAGGSQATYTLLEASLFTTAISIRDANPNAEVVVVCHGLYSKGEYTGNLQDCLKDAWNLPEATRAKDVDPKFRMSFHCGSETNNALITNNDVGRALAAAKAKDGYMDKYSDAVAKAVDTPTRNDNGASQDNSGGGEGNGGDSVAADDSCEQPESSNASDQYAYSETSDSHATVTIGEYIYLGYEDPNDGGYRFDGYAQSC